MLTHVVLDRRVRSSLNAITNSKKGSILIIDRDALF
jgi:hypothetical protein